MTISPHIGNSGIVRTVYSGVFRHIQGHSAIFSNIQIIMHIHIPSIVRTVYSSIFKVIQAYLGILMHIQPHSQCSFKSIQEKNPTKLISCRASFLVFLKKCLSKFSNSTNLLPPAFLMKYSCWCSCTQTLFFLLNTPS